MLITKCQQHAKVHLQKFFVGLRRLYFKMQVFNSHSAIHAAGDVLEMGFDFNRICAFGFKNIFGNQQASCRLQTVLQLKFVVDYIN